MSKIGRFCIQHDWLEALEDGESFWISFYGRKDAEPSSIHGKVNRSLFSQEFESVKKENRELVIELDEETEATFIYSDKVFQASDGLFKAKFLDVSPREGLALANDISNDNEFVQVIDLETKETLLSLYVKPAPHFARFFPSGEVIIFASHNEIYLAGLKSGKIVRRFKGHSESITGIEFIEEGRNFISCSADGKLLLWECSSGEEVSTLKSSCDPKGPINCLRIYQTGNDASFSESENFFWKKETFAVCGTEEGYFRIISVPKGTIKWEHKFSSAICSLEILDDRFIAGCRDGSINSIWRDSFQDVSSFFYPHAVLSLSTQIAKESQKTNIRGDLYVSFGGTGVAVFRILDNSESPLEPMHNELTGSDCEPVLQILNRKTGIWTTSRDGFLRFYSLKSS